MLPRGMPAVLLAVLSLISQSAALTSHSTGREQSERQQILKSAISTASGSDQFPLLPILPIAPLLPSLAAGAAAALVDGLVKAASHAGGTASTAQTSSTMLPPTTREPSNPAAAGTPPPTAEETSNPAATGTLPPTAEETSNPAAAGTPPPTAEETSNPAATGTKAPHPLQRRKLLKEISEQVRVSKEQMGKDQQLLNATRHRTNVQERKLMELKKWFSVERNKMADYEKHVKLTVEETERMKEEHQTLLARLTGDSCVVQVDKTKSNNQALEAITFKAVETIKRLQAEVAAQTAAYEDLRKQTYGNLPEETFRLSPDELDRRAQDAQEEEERLAAQVQQIQQHERDLMTKISNVRERSVGATGNPPATPHDKPRYILGLMSENADLLDDVEFFKEEAFKSEFNMTKLEAYVNTSTSELAAKKIKNDAIAGQLAELKQEYNDMSHRERNVEMLAQAETEVVTLRTDKLKLNAEIVRLEAQTSQLAMRNQHRQAYREWKHEWNEPAQDIKTKDQLEQDWANKYR